MTNCVNFLILANPYLLLERFFLPHVFLCASRVLLCVCMEKHLCVVFSASLDPRPLVTVGDGVNFPQVNKGSTHTLTRTH